MFNSYLFVPGNRLDRVKKALCSKADVVIIDFEDAVPEREKIRVREDIEHFLSQQDFSQTTQICIRVNDRTTPYFEADVAMVAKFPNTIIMLPKTELANDVQQLENIISSKQSIIPLIETAKGILNAYSIASSSQHIHRLAFGAVDYCFDLNISISSHGQELIYPRSALVVASRAAGLEAPIDTVYTDISDEEGLILEIHRAKTLGLFSKLCIHPAQLHHVNLLFGPSQEEVAWAQKVVKSFEQALEQGLSAIKIDNEMIDLPVYKKALETLKKTTLSV